MRRKVVSAHRTPERLYDYAAVAPERGLKVIIAGAGGAAHLPGMAASMTELPVLGVPVETKALAGIDSLLSIVQMPAGIPVGTLAIGKAGAINAGCSPPRSWPSTDEALAARLAAWRAEQTDGVAEHARMIVPPGSTIGIVGGGQLGRMLALAAAQLGYRCHVFAPDERPCAAEVAAALHPRRVRRRGGAARASPARSTSSPMSSRICRSRRSPRSGDKLQPGTPQRWRSRRTGATRSTSSKRCGGRVAPWRDGRRPRRTRRRARRARRAGVLKTRRFGYDGKGQARIDAPSEADAAWDAIGGAPAVAEAAIDFDAEFSILLCRGADGETALWDAPATATRAASCVTSTVPAGPSSIAAQSPRPRRSRRRDRRRARPCRRADDRIFRLRRRAAVQRNGAARPQ